MGAWQPPHGRAPAVSAPAPSHWNPATAVRHVIACDSKKPGRNQGQGGQGNGWLAWLRGASSKLQVPLRLVFNVSALFLLMRVWPNGLGGRAALGDSAGIVQLPFSEFVKRAKLNEVHTISVDGTHVAFSLRPNSNLQPKTQEPSRITFFTVRPADYALDYQLLEKNSVMYSASDKKQMGLFTIMSYVLCAGLLFATMNKLRLPGKSGPGRKHVKGDKDGERPLITFADVAGVDEAKEELGEIVEFLRSPERFAKLGARPPCGVLLVGPPGTGKTLLAKAVAGEANVPFYSISASEFVELYVGMGAMRVRELFATARKEAPSIVFIDEIDAVAKGRDMRMRSVGNDEREQTLNQLLTELDGFDSEAGAVICLAATNRPDVLDPALLRPGRFDRRVSVERPDRIGREQILKVHLERRGLPLADDVNVPQLASSTTGFTGADLANLVNEAALLAGRQSKEEVGAADFEAAVMRSLAGIEKKRSVLQGLEKETVAKHEVGHALVATCIHRLLPASASEVSKLSIVPRSGGALGFTFIPAQEDRVLSFDCDIRAQLAVLLGGRAAEHLTCHALSTGASDDIKRATELAYRTVSEFGLSSSIGPINVGVLSGGGEGESLLQSQSSVSRVVDAEVKALIEGALCCALHVVAANQGLHEGLSGCLLSKERLEGQELTKWLEHIQVPDSLRLFVLEGKVPDRSLLARSQPDLQQLLLDLGVGAGASSSAPASIAPTPKGTSA